MHIRRFNSLYHIKGFFWAGATLLETEYVLLCPLNRGPPSEIFETGALATQSQTGKSKTKQIELRYTVIT